MSEAVETQGGRRGGLVTFVAVLAAGLGALGAAGWQASSRPAIAEPAPADQKSAADAVYLFLSLAAHLRGTADPRYSERLPAAPELVEELQREIQWVRLGGRMEEPRLVRAEVRAITPASGTDELEVRTKEFWVTRDLSAPEAKPRSDVVLAKYVVRREASGWRVAGWDIDAGVAGGGVR